MHISEMMTSPGLEAVTSRRESEPVSKCCVWTPGVVDRQVQLAGPDQRWDGLVQSPLEKAEGVVGRGPPAGTEWTPTETPARPSPLCRAILALWRCVDKEAQCQRQFQSTSRAHLPWELITC